MVGKYPTNPKMVVFPTENDGNFGGGVLGVPFI